MRRLSVSYLVVTILLCGPSYFAWSRKPFAIGSLEFDPWLGLIASRQPAQFAHVLLFTLCSIIYVIIANSNEKLPRWLVPATWLTYLCAVPWISPDVFFYLSKGWLAVHYGLDPYTTAVSSVPAFESDAIFASMVPGLTQQLGNYGPIFQFLSALIARMAQGSPVVGLLLFKIVTALSFWGCYLLLCELAKASGKSSDHIARYFLLNPLLLFNFLCAAHNDSLLMLPILAGVIAAIRGRVLLAGFLLGVAISFKLVGVFLLPVIAAYLFLAAPRDDLLRLIVALIFGSIIGIVGGVSLSASATEYFQAVLRYDAQVFRSSVHVFASPMIQRLGNPFGMDSLAWGKIIFVSLATLCIWWNASQNRKRPADFMVLTGFEVLLLAQYFVLPSMNEWYLLWPFCFALCCDDRLPRDWLLQLSVCYMPIVVFAIVGPQLTVVAAQMIILATLTTSLVVYFYSRAMRAIAA